MSPIISFAGGTGTGAGVGAEAVASAGVPVSAGEATLVSRNSPHCSDVRVLFTLTSKNAGPKSLLGYADSGTATAATAAPPGCTKSIGTGADETSSSAASP